MSCNRLLDNVILSFKWNQRFPSGSNSLSIALPGIFFSFKKKHASNEKYINYAENNINYL